MDIAVMISQRAKINALRFDQPLLWVRPKLRWPMYLPTSAPKPIKKQKRKIAKDTKSGTERLSRALCLLAFQSFSYVIGSLK